MDPTELAEGMIIDATSFDGVPLKITILSSVPVGSGGTSRVYKGRCDAYDRPWLVAVKVLTGRIDALQEELLTREVRALHELQHRLRQIDNEKILAFVGASDPGSRRMAIISLYMKNGNLLGYLRQHMDVDKQRLILQVAGAVTYLHSTGLVHGDIKCANILISDFGDALLADFGLSTFAEMLAPTAATVSDLGEPLFVAESGSMTTVAAHSGAPTATGICNMFTLRFAAPELLLGTAGGPLRVRSKTRESDVYAFGMLVLEAVTEEPPWSGLSAQAVLIHVASGQVPPRPVSISNSWWAVCLHCWKFNARDRPAMETVSKSLSTARLEPYMVIPDSSTSWFHGYLPNGRCVVSWQGEISIFDPATGQKVTTTRAAEPYSHWQDAPAQVAISPCNGGQLAAAAGADIITYRWDAPIRLRTRHTPAANLKIEYISYSPDGRRLAWTCAGDNTVRIWDAVTMRPPLEGPLVGHTARVTTVAFAPNSEYVASGSEDATIRIWDPATPSGEHLETLEHEGAVCSVAYSPNGEFIVSGSRDTTVRIWDAASRQLVRTIRGHIATVTCVAVSPSKKCIASASEDGTVRIWDMLTGRPVGVPLTGQQRFQNTIAFSPDGKRLASSKNTLDICLWEIFE